MASGPLQASDKQRCEMAQSHPSSTVHMTSRDREGERVSPPPPPRAPCTQGGYWSALCPPYTAVQNTMQPQSRSGTWPTAFGLDAAGRASLLNDSPRRSVTRALRRIHCKLDAAHSTTSCHSFQRMLCLLKHKRNEPQAHCLKAKISSLLHETQDIEYIGSY